MLNRLFNQEQEAGKNLKRKRRRSRRQVGWRGRTERRPFRLAANATVSASWGAALNPDANIQIYVHHSRLLSVSPPPGHPPRPPDVAPLTLRLDGVTV